MVWKSFRGKLIITYLLLIIFSMLLLGGYLLHSLERYYLSNLEDQLLKEALLVQEIIKEAPPEASLEEIAARAGEASGSRVTLISANGRVLGDSEETAAQMECHADRPEVKEALSKGQGSATRHSSTLETGMMYTASWMPYPSDSSPLVVRLALPLTAVYQEIHSLRAQILAGIALATLLALAAGLRLARRVIDPVERVSLAAEKISRGEFEHQVELTTGDELEKMGKSLNQMAASLHKQMQEITESRKRLESILSTLTSGVIFLDNHGKVNLLNPAARKILALEDNRVSKRHHLQVIKNYELSSLIDQVLQDKKPLKKTITLIYPQEKALECTAAPLSAGQGEAGGAVVLLYDLSEIKKLERARRDLVASISHELKTPVTAIKGFLETLQDGAAGDPALREEFLGIMQTETERLYRLINDLLELARLEARELQLHFQKLDLGQIARHALAVFQPEAQKAGITLEGKIPQKPLAVKADEQRLQQVLANLLHNALRFTPAGGKVCLELAGQKQSVKVLVTDTGEGISPQDLPRVFERLYKADRARSRRQGGSGLGLAIVKHLVERHGGTVGVESHPGQGSTFWFTLPLLT